MQLDIAILIIIAIFTIFGFKNGFVHTIFFAFGWLIAIAVAFFTRGTVKKFIIDNTHIYDWYHERVYDVCLKFISGYTNKLTGGQGIADGVTGGAMGDALEAVGGAGGGAMGGALEAVGGAGGGAVGGALEAVGGAVGAAGEKITQAAADQIASTSFGVFCFIGTVLVVKLFLFLITLALSRRYRGGFVGALDATGGLLLGVAQGFIVVFIVLVLILPVSLAISPGLFEKASGALNSSFFAKTLFTMNPLIPLIDGFAPGLFDPSKWLDKIGSR
jgi:uncharacterized membrane protein required for colicin V production